jgi:preprotein translocase subunit SecD
MGRHALSLLALLLVAGAACQASPEPTAAMRTMTVTIPVPIADKTVSIAAVDVFSKRLKALGVGNFTVSTGNTMKFVMLVPLTFDGTLVDAVLRRNGTFELVPWPADMQPPNSGDRIPATTEPIVDSTEFKSAVATTDSTGNPALLITLGPIGTEAFATYTTGHVMSWVPLVMDGVVLVAPTISSPITDGKVLITGPEAFPIPLTAIIAIIDSGPLPDAWTAQP